MHSNLITAARGACPGPYLEAPYLPSEVSDLLAAFPAEIGSLSPDPGDIPDEFWDDNNEWSRLASRWFFKGLPVDAGFAPSKTLLTLPGEAESAVGAAIKHLGTILGSYQPKHEHKMAATAFLFSQWFDYIDLGDGSTVGSIPEEGDA